MLLRINVCIKKGKIRPMGLHFSVGRRIRCNTGVLYIIPYIMTGVLYIIPYIMTGVLQAYIIPYIMAGVL